LRYAAARRYRGWRRGGRTLEEGQHIVLGDAALLTGAAQFGEIDTELARQPAHAGAGMRITRARGERCRGGGWRRRGGLGRRGRRLVLRQQRGWLGDGAFAAAQRQDGGALAHLVADLDQDLFHRAAG